MPLRKILHWIAPLEKKAYFEKLIEGAEDAIKIIEIANDETIFLICDIEKVSRVLAQKQSELQKAGREDIYCRSCSFLKDILCFHDKKLSRLTRTEFGSTATPLPPVNSNELTLE